MKPHRPSIFAGAVPLDGRGHSRTPAVQLLIDERVALIRAAARFYPGAKNREVARRLHAALSTYRGGRFIRDRACEVCPPQHKGKLTAVLWITLKVHDHVPSEMTIRRALATRDPEGVLHFDI